MTQAHGGYYVPHGSHWPIVGSVGLITMLGGFAFFLNGTSAGSMFMIAGAAIIV